MYTKLLVTVCQFLLTLNWRSRWSKRENVIIVRNKRKTNNLGKSKTSVINWHDGAIVIIITVPHLHSLIKGSIPTFTLYVNIILRCASPYSELRAPLRGFGEQGNKTNLNWGTR